MSPSEDLLLLTLQTAVPLRMFELAHESDNWLKARAQHAADAIAEHGDAILYGVPTTKYDRKGTARAFNELVTGLAVLALTAPGGVAFAGLHFCHDHAGCREAS